MSDDLDTKSVELLRDIADDIESGKQSVEEFELSNHIAKGRDTMGLVYPVPTGTYDIKFWFRREGDDDE